MLNLLSKFLDDHLRFVRASIAVIGISGFVIFMRKSQIIRVYNSVHEIPDDFIKNRVRLRGIVQEVCQCGHLKVKHQRLLFPNLIKSNSSGLLNLKLAGIQPCDAYLSFAKSNINNKVFHFTLLQKEENDFGHIIAFVKPRFFELSLNELLIENGLAIAKSPEFLINNDYQRFLKHLVHLEIKTDKRGKKGIWKRKSFLEKLLHRLR